jgi:HAD superfamily hydrolase (TIGR01509 family)
MPQASGGGASAPPVVIFDLDGTLADSVPGLKELFCRFLADRGIDDGPGLFRRLAGRTIPEILETVRAEYGLAPDVGGLVDAYLDRLRAFYLEVAPMSGADDVLRDLSRSGVVIALATSAAQNVIGPFLDRTGWTDVFAAVACGDEVAHGKPAPDIFLLARERAGGGAMIVVEDSGTGVVAGAAAGARVIGFAPAGDGAALRAAGAECVVADLREIPALVATWNRLSTS